jgi:hypothetical protein
MFLRNFFRIAVKNVGQRVRGTVEGVEGPMLTVQSRDCRTTYKVKMANNVSVRGTVKASLSDIKQNSFIGVTGMPQPTAVRRRWKSTFSRRLCAALAKAIVHGT